MLTRIEATIKKHDLFAKTDRILVAVSGGPDSVFLAYTLHQLGYKIGVAHVNYQLRGEESDAEEGLVRNLASILGVHLHSAKYPTASIVDESSDSLQMVARNLRYAFFEEIMQKEGYGYCATAHHRDDQVETILMSVVKGNSPAWLAGIPYKRERFVRPLLEVSKEEIIEELTRQSIPFAIDSSNLKADYTRNKVRNQVIPLLEEINPAVSTHIFKRFAWHQRQQAFLNDQFEGWYQQFATEASQHKQLDLEAWEKVHSAKWADLFCVFSLEKWGLHGNQVWEALKLYDSEVGKEVLGEWGRITRDRKGFTWQPVEQSVQPPLVIDPLTDLFEGEYKGRKIILSVVSRESVSFDAIHSYFLDLEKVVFPITLRNWHVGDRMIPFGMRRPKKLSDIFTDEKYSPYQKDHAVVVEDAERIICLSEFRISDDVRIGEESREILKIKIE